MHLLLSSISTWKEFYKELPMGAKAPEVRCTCGALFRSPTLLLAQENCWRMSLQANKPGVSSKGANRGPQLSSVTHSNGEMDRLPKLLRLPLDCGHMALQMPASCQISEEEEKSSSRTRKSWSSLLPLARKRPTDLLLDAEIVRWRWG